MRANDLNLFVFWAKLPRRKEEFPPTKFHPLLCHMIDVAAVIEHLWENILPDTLRHRFATDLSLPTEAAGKWLALLAGLHDLGKLSPKFQFKHEAEVLYKANDSLLHQFYLDTNGLRCRNDAYHQWVTALELPHILSVKPFGVGMRSAKRFGEILGGHHGAFPSSLQLVELEKYQSQCIGGGIWKKARHELTLLLANILEVPLDAKPQSTVEQIESNAFAMMFAGLVSVADWIGSNTDYFPLAAIRINQVPLINAQNYLCDSRERAEIALERLGWHGVPTLAHPAAKLDFNQLFAYLAPQAGEIKPNELQQAVIDCTNDLRAPCLAIIEAPMGMGKTEAAMFLADRWSIAPERNGFYFALPTQATSNQMYGRILRFLQHRLPHERVNFQLLHGQASLSAELVMRFKVEHTYDDKTRNRGEGSVAAEEWFMHRKRGLLSQFGVGTVDQILLAALQTRHFFMRLFGLTGKTIIVDEVHAYDTYMTTLLERLLEWLAALDCSVILLSATLPTEKRQTLVAAYQRGCGHQDDVEIPGADYPRLTFTVATGAQAKSLKDAQKNTPASIVEIPSRELLIKWINGELPELAVNEFPLGEQLQRALAAGGCAAVICNTVDRAQKMYATLKDHFARSKRRYGSDEPEVFLFHARYLFKDRERLEKEVLWRFGTRGDIVDFGDEGARQGKHIVERPFRTVLVATQIIEQSLDLDFDLMVSDFAPVDLLLQRSGRVHRHSKNPRYELPSPTLWLCRPRIIKDIPRFDDGTEAVYDHHVLLRSWLALMDLAKDTDEMDEMRIRLPSDIETLVEAAYKSRACPEELSEEMRARWGETEQQQRATFESHKSQASVKSLPPPTYRNHIGGFSQQEFEEDAPEIHQAHQALTRLGDSVQVVCLYGTKARPYFDAARTQSIDPTREPIKEDAVRLLRHALSLSLKGLVHTLRDEAVPSGWKNSPLLRHHRLIALDEPPNGYKLTLDAERGVVVEKE
jgi:CRISPR-associated endonuclease/helicase Cas3